MDVSRMFQEVLEKIEHSNLNYTMLKTPFSANISIKRSLIKFHDESLPKKTYYQEKVKETPSFELNENMRNAVDQNENLKNLLKQE